MENDGGSLLTSKVDKGMLDGMRGVVTQLANKHGCVAKKVCKHRNSSSTFCNNWVFSLCGRGHSFEAYASFTD